MNINRVFPFLAASVLILSILACNFGTSATQPADAIPTENQPSEVPQATAMPTEAPNACDNPYLPVVLGATWNYKLTGPIPDTFKHTILSVEPDGFVEQDVFGTGVTRQAEWKCENGNLIALNPPSASAGTVNAEGVSVDLKNTALSGITLPATINAGDTWSQSLTLEGTETINGTTFPVSNQLTSDCTAKGIESVTVEAGTFDAMRVDCHTTMHLSLKMSETPTEMTLDLTGTNWYVENVGLVKTSTAGSGLDSTTELTSYDIP